jgi:CheY-like chemotaxis protein
VTKGHILVVDDISDVRATLSGFLIDEGYDICSAASMEEALELLAINHFDVAVLDVRLDETDEDNRDGLLLMHTIKKKYPHTVSVLLTGYADVKMVREALQPDSRGVAPAFGFLEKSEIGKLHTYVDRAVKHAAVKNETSVTDLIAQGENDRVEFKSSMRWDYRQNRVNKVLQAVVAKTVAGIMNYQGGILLIGVADDGEVLGIEEDLKTLRKPNLDGYQLALTDIIKTYLGLEYVPYIYPQFQIAEDKYVCVIKIQESPKPVFLNKGKSNEFWVRMGNSTRKLDVREATHYILEKWGKLD